jgi:hypothetical protein
MEKVKINSGHYLELMDRLHVAMSTINDHILEHPLTEQEPDVQSLVEDAISNLWDAYQLVGGLDNENKN